MPGPAIPPQPPEPPAQKSRWFWILAVLFFPAGPFIGLALGKVISWPRAIISAALSSALLIPIVMTLRALEARQGPEIRLDLTNLVLRLLLTLAGAIYCVGVGWYQYRLGKRYGYWSWQAGRLWKILLILGILLLSVTVLLAALVVLLLATSTNIVS